MQKETKGAVMALVCMIAALITFSGAAFAHHGTGISYDEKHPMVVKRERLRVVDSNNQLEIVPVQTA